MCSNNLLIQDDQEKIIEIEEGILAWIDNDTSLMWEVKTKESIGFWYIWHRTYKKDFPDDIKDYLEDEIIDCTSYVDKMNDRNYAGFNDWRLPSVAELESLIDESNENFYIKKPLLRNTFPAYWTSTPEIILEHYKTPYSHRFHWKDLDFVSSVKFVDFKKPLTANYKPQNTLWVRCVRDNVPPNNEDHAKKTKKIDKPNSYKLSIIPYSKSIHLYGDNTHITIFENLFKYNLTDDQPFTFEENATLNLAKECVEHCFYYTNEYLNNLLTGKRYKDCLDFMLHLGSCFNSSTNDKFLEGKLSEIIYHGIIDPEKLNILCDFMIYSTLNIKSTEILKKLSAKLYFQVFENIIILSKKIISNRRKIVNPSYFESDDIPY